MNDMVNRDLIVRRGVTVIVLSATTAFAALGSLLAGVSANNTVVITCAGILASLTALVRYLVAVGSKS
jgi:hypothetical protein